MNTDPVLAELTAMQRRFRAPSIAAAVLRDGQLAWSGAAGHLDGRTDGPRATAETSYRIGSITKTFTAVAVLQLVRDGLVDLDESVRAYLPELPQSLDRVTVDSVLTHSSGLLAETEAPWWERSQGRTWRALAPTIRRVDHPIRRFHYSNVGFAVAGEIVARLRDSSWMEAIHSGILEPLGLSHTSYGPTDDSAPGLAVHPYADVLQLEPPTDTLAMAPAGQLWSTVGDLTIWGGFLARGDERILPEPLRRMMLVPTVVDDVPGRAWSRAYGHGVDVYNRDGIRYVGHGGSMPGFLAALSVDPDTGDGIVALTNTTGNADLSQSWSLLETHRRLVPATTLPWTAISDGADLDLTGLWYWGPRAFTMRSTAGGVLVLAPVSGGRGSRFEPVGDGTWIGLDEYYAGERLTVHARDERSAYLDLGSFRFTRTPYDPDAHIPGGVHPSGWH